MECDCGPCPSADHRKSTLLPKHQMDFVTANDHAKSAIIAQMRTVLTQAKHSLPTVKDAFIRGTLQDLDGFTGLVKRVDIVAETRDRVVVVDTWGDTCMVTFCVGDLQCVIDFLVLYL